MFYKPIQHSLEKTALQQNNYIFRNFKPHISLASFIDCYWYFSPKPGACTNVAFKLIPDGCSNIIFDLHDFNRILCFFEGTKSRYEPTIVFPHRRLFGIRLLPGMGYKLFKYIFTGCVDETIPVDLCVIHKDIKLDIPRIFDNPDICSIITALDYQLQNFDFHFTTENFDNVVNTIYKHKGKIEISELASCLFISPRQLNRLFNEYIGIPTKKFAEIIRFQHSIRHIVSYTNGTLTDIAYNAGFYDQSHFIKAFNMYYGCSPGKV